MHLENKRIFQIPITTTQTAFMCLENGEDVSNGDHSQDVLTQPADSSISSFRQFEPILKFHGTKAFNDETITFQNLTGGLPYTEKTELESHVYNYAKDNDIKEDSFKEENPVGNSTSRNKD